MTGRKHRQVRFPLCIHFERRLSKPQECRLTLKKLEAIFSVPDDKVLENN